MNTRYFAVAIAAAIAFPVAGYAQESSSTVTRAQVRAELDPAGKRGLPARPRQRSALPHRHSGGRSSGGRSEGRRVERRQRHGRCAQRFV